MTSANPQPGHRIARATIAYGIGGVLPKVTAFLLVPLYAVYLSPADFGLVDLVGAFGGLVAILMRLGVPGAVSRFYFDHREGEPLRDYVTTIARFLNGTSVVVGTLALLLILFAGDMLLPRVPVWPFAVVAVASSVLSANSDLQRRLLQAREQAGYSATLSVVSAGANIALALLLVVGLQMGAIGIVLAGLVANLGFFLQAQHYLAEDLKGGFRLDLLRTSLRYGCGILPIHILGSFAPLFTRSFVAGAVSLAAVGHFGVATRFVSPLAVLVSAVGAAYLPVYFSLRKQGTAEAGARLVESTESVWSVAILATLGVAAAAPPLIDLVMPARYGSAADLVPLLALGTLAQLLLILKSAEFFWESTPWKVAVVSAIGVATTIVLVVPLVSRFGILGLAWAQTAGDAMAAGGAAVLSRRVFRLPFSSAEVLSSVAVCSIVWALLQWAPVSSDLARLGWGCAAVPIGVLALWLGGHRGVRRTLAAASRGEFSPFRRAG